MSNNKLNPIRFVLFLAVCLCTVPVLNAQQMQSPGNKERAINLSIEIDAPVDKVWDQWTTTESISKFFAPSSRIELKPMGHFDIYFFPNAPEGSRGAEGNFILGVQEKQMLSFTWDAPPQWPEIRKQRTFVTVRFHKLSEKKSQVTLMHTGWGNSAEWDAVYNYFISAWGDVVLPFLKYSIEVKPVDWTDFPKKLPAGLKPAARL